MFDMLKYTYSNFHKFESMIVNLCVIDFTKRKRFPHKEMCSFFFLGGGGLNVIFFNK